MKKISLEEYLSMKGILDYHKKEYLRQKEYLENVLVNETWDFAEDVVKIKDVDGLDLILEPADINWYTTKHTNNQRDEKLLILIEDSRDVGAGYCAGLNLLGMKKLADYLNHKIKYLEEIE